MKWRVACVLIPDFAIECMTRSLSAAEGKQPIALVDTKEHAHVRALNQVAARSGVALGQTATRARARCPHLRCIKWHTERIACASTQLGDALRVAAPRVKPLEATPGAYWLDARGMRWLGGEPSLGQRAIKAAEQAGYMGLRVGIADTLQTGQAAALQTTESSPVLIIPPGQDLTFLKRLSLNELTIDETLRQVMYSLGLTRVSDLARLPICTLTTRFGDLGRRAWEHANGQDHRRVEERASSNLPETVLVLDEPVSNINALVFGLKNIAAELADQLKDLSYSASSLALVLSLDDHSEIVETLFPARPLNHPDGLFELIRDRLNRVLDERSEGGTQGDALSSPVVEVRLQVLQMGPTNLQQTQMGSGRWDPNALERALDRLSGRFEQRIVFEAKAQNHTRVDGSGCWQGVHEVPISPPATKEDKGVITLLSPVRRRVRTPPRLHVRADAEGRPLAIRWRGRWHSVDARGPERLSGGWWEHRPYAYEDYRAILQNQEVLWIRHDAHSRSWSLQGWFD